VLFAVRELPFAIHVCNRLVTVPADVLVGALEEQHVILGVVDEEEERLLGLVFHYVSFGPAIRASGEAALHCLYHRGRQEDGEDRLGFSRWSIAVCSSVIRDHDVTPSIGSLRRKSRHVPFSSMKPIQRKDGVMTSTQ
jgi:hypothetical protein